MARTSVSDVGDPEAPGTRLRRADRLSAILERLSSDRSLGVTDLAERFGVSQATLRRDLQVLDEQGLVNRVHGGVLAPAISHEVPVRYRDCCLRTRLHPTTSRTIWRFSAWGSCGWGRPRAS